jgi:hypothetical protein
MVIRKNIDTLIYDYLWYKIEYIEYIENRENRENIENRKNRE